MVEYTVAKKEQRQEIIDFINYVFSYTHRPHDFKTLLPKGYRDEKEDLGAVHFLAEEDGKIKALIALRAEEVFVCGEYLKMGFIGNVSVHPYARGKGYMKQLMQKVITYANNQKLDYLILGGQRQRYGYFGFENAGVDFVFTVSKSNIRHCLGDLDLSKIKFLPMAGDMARWKQLYQKRSFHVIRKEAEFLEVLRSWDAECNLIYKDGEPIGYISGEMSEVVLENEADYGLVLAAYFEEKKPEEIKIRVSPFLKERATFLSAVCERCSIESLEMVRVLDWKRVLLAFLKLKGETEPLSDGEMTIGIDGQGYKITVKNAIPSVELCEKSEGALSHIEAEQFFFGIDTLLFPKCGQNNWFPLPLSCDGPDGF